MVPRLARKTKTMIAIQPTVVGSCDDGARAGAVRAADMEEREDSGFW